MYAVPSVFQRVAEELAGRLPVVLGGEAAQGEKIGAARFTAVVGHGKGQLHVLLIGGSYVGSRTSDGFGQQVQ